jgi:hypothetical protein
VAYVLRTSSLTELTLAKPSFRRIIAENSRSGRSIYSARRRNGAHSDKNFSGGGVRIWSAVIMAPP